MIRQNALLFELDAVQGINWITVLIGCTCILIRSITSCRWSAVQIQPRGAAIEVEQCCHGAMCLTCCQSRRWIDRWTWSCLDLRTRQQSGGRSWRSKQRPGPSDTATTGSGGDLDLLPCGRRPAPRLLRLAAPPPPPSARSGRASCRERVSSYV